MSTFLREFTSSLPEPNVCVDPDADQPKQSVDSNAGQPPAPEGTITIPEVTVVGDSGGVCRDPNVPRDPPEPKAPNTCEPQDLRSRATDPGTPDHSRGGEAAKELAKSGFWHVV